MHKRTKVCAISKKTKDIVKKRDGECCIFCGAPGLPEAHVVPRSHGGLGVPENIVTACRPCHDLMDNSTKRKEMLQKAADHLKGFYPDWNEQNLIFDKWHKDKAKEQVKTLKTREIQQIQSNFAEKPQKDKEKPPEGFYFLEGNDGEI